MADSSAELADDYCRFSWEINGYDAYSSTIKSPMFITPFKSTEWHIELDLSRINNHLCVIPCKLCRHDNVGPPLILMKVEASVKTKRESNYVFKIASKKIFTEYFESFWNFDIKIPREEMGKDWITSKKLFITVEMRLELSDYQDLRSYWGDSEDKILLSKEIIKLYETGMYHDLVLNVSDQEFKLHKCILQSRWPYFMSKFSIDKSTSSIDLSDCADLKVHTLKRIFPFLYSGEMAFLADIENDDESRDIVQLAVDYNLYRLREKIIPVTPTCDSIQLLQSYRISFKMILKNANTGKAMGDYRAIEIPLQSSSDNNVPHIKFMDVRLYIKKEVNGYNWLLFSIVLGRLPKNNPVTIKCKLYVIDTSNCSHLLTEQNILFDENTMCSFFLPDIEDFHQKLQEGVENYKGRMKTCHRFYKKSDPIITFRELSDPRLNFLHERDEYDPEVKKTVKRHDLHFRFDIKLSDGESVTNTKRGKCLIRPRNGLGELSEDMEKLLNDKTYSDYTVISGPLKMQVHKAILAARSEVFRKLFEANENLKRTPVMITKELLYPFMQYIYAGKILQEPNCIKYLLNASTYYMVDRLYHLLKSKHTEDASENDMSP